MTQQTFFLHGLTRAMYRNGWILMLCLGSVGWLEQKAFAQLPTVSDSRLGVDCLKLNNGKRLYGFLLDQDPQSGRFQSGRFAVERAWLATTHPLYFAELEDKEQTQREQALTQQRTRLIDWIAELEEGVLKRFLQSEQSRTEQRTASQIKPSQFAIVEFEKQEVRDLSLARPELRQIAGIAFRENLVNVTITPATYLRRQLDALNVDASKEQVDLQDRLPTTRKESDRQWAAKQALIEYAFGRELEFQGTNDLLVRKGDDQADVGQLLTQAMSANSANMVQQLGADLGLPEFAQFAKTSKNDAWKSKVIRVAEEENFRGALVSRLDQNLLSSEVKVTVTFLAKPKNGDWFQAFEYVARADANNQPAERLQRIKDDPQVKQLLSMVQSLGLGSRLDQALRQGAATEQALNDGSAEFNEFLSRFGSKVDGPSVPGL